MNKSNTTSILNSQYGTCTSQIDHREMMGVDWTAMLSKAHSSVPRRIRKKPFSPQFSPQLFFVIQNFSPATIYAKAPLGFTVVILKLLSQQHYFPNTTIARGFFFTEMLQTTNIKLLIDPKNIPHFFFLNAACNIAKTTSVKISL